MSANKGTKKEPKGCDTAIHQLEKRDYAAHWRNEGYTDIIQYGICFYKKECMIKICK